MTTNNDCDHNWKYIGSKRQTVWECTRCGMLKVPETTNKDAITDPALVWRTMDDCPTGPKVLLLNKAGIASTGWWDGKDKWWVGWFPLPKIPPEIRDLIEPTYRPQSNIGSLIGD